MFGKGKKELAALVTETTWRVLSELRASECSTGRGGEHDLLFWSRQGGALSENVIYRMVKKQRAKRALATVCFCTDVDAILSQIFLHRNKCPILL